MGEMAWPSCVCPWSVFPGFKYGLGTRGCEILSLVMVLGGGMMSDFQSSRIRIRYRVSRGYYSDPPARVNFFPSCFLPRAETLRCH